MNDLEKKLRQFERNLNERVKELGCLYALSAITAISNITITDVLKETIKIIPPAWQYPEITKQESPMIKVNMYQKISWKANGN